MALSPATFQRIVYKNYKKYGRDYPWRHTKNPYHIFVAEIMLQQTQTDRVVEKYIQFIKTFPTIKKLSRASTKKIYSEWRGLGYNRRALALKRSAKIITKEYQGKIPEIQSKLETLPGIGPYTASAILAFAYNKPAVLIETNIRTVYIFHYHKNKNRVLDVQLLKLIEKTMDTKNPTLWYTALMDYGAHLKKTRENFSKKSALYTKQSPFKGSRREMRGNILKLLSKKNKLTISQIQKFLAINTTVTTSILKDLENEGFVKRVNSFFKLT